MADTYEKDFAQKSSLTTSDYIRVVGSDNVSYKQPLLDVGAKGQVGQIGLLSNMDIDNFATNKTYGTWWLNCGDSAVTGTKPASSGQGLLICKQQSTSIYRQVYISVSGSEMKFRYHNGSAWVAWSDMPARAEIDALTTIYVSQVGTTSSTGWILLQYNGSNVSYNNYEVISAYNNGKILIPFVSSGNWYVKALEYGSMASVANTQLTCYFRLLKK